MDCFHLELAIKAQVAHPTPRRAIKKWVLFLGTLNAVVIGICPFHKCRISVIVERGGPHRCNKLLYFLASTPRHETRSAGDI